MYDCVEIRSVERDMFHTWRLCLLWVIHGAHNDPWTVPITVSSHSTYDIASSHKDKSLQRQCQGGAAIGCEGLSCITVHSILSLFPISADLMFFCQFASSTLSYPGQWQSRNTRRVEYGGCSSQKTGAARQERALRLITLLLGGSARSCLNRPRPAGD